MPPIYYPAVIDRSASGFGVSFPDFPGCVANGATVQEAAVQAEAALALHLDGMRADKDAIPQPSALDDIDPVEGADDVARVLVRADMPGTFSRIQVTIEDSVLAAIDANATNRSSFLTEAARSALKERTGVDFTMQQARRVYVMQAKSDGPWRVSPHFTSSTRDGRPVAASTYLENKFDDPEEAREFAAKVFCIDPRQVIVQPKKEQARAS